jgi:hypothetical protein
MPFITLESKQLNEVLGGWAVLMSPGYGVNYTYTVPDGKVGRRIVPVLNQPLEPTEGFRH